MADNVPAAMTSHAAASAPVQDSETAWKIASLYSGVLASETRDLAAHIDVAIAAERNRCMAICETWIGTFQDRDIQYTSARDYAIDAIEDIIDLIRDGYNPAPTFAQGKQQP